MKFHKIGKYLIAFIVAISIIGGDFYVVVSAGVIPTTSLQYNTVMNNNYEWVNNYSGINLDSMNYNCYAYAINRVEPEPYYSLFNDRNWGTWSQYQPGNMTENEFPLTADMSVYDVAEFIKDDLIALGYDSNSISISDLTPNTSILLPEQELICLRMGANISEDYPFPFDYHCMKYDAKTNAWYHKPGGYAILKYNYTPLQNNHTWIGEVQDNYGTYINNFQYDSEIVYITFSKLQLDTSYGIVEKEVALKSDRDIIYEVLVPETGEYTFEISSDCQEANYVYEIYSYNMYNGDYQSIAIDMGNSSIASSESINLISPSDFDNPYQAKKYYIRLWFDRSISDDYSINLSIAHPHSYTNHYEQYSATQHKAYCECGEYITASHEIVGGVCTLCGEPHEHSYNGDCVWKSFTYHRDYCECGDYIDSAHVVSAGAFGGGNKYAFCLACGGRAEIGIVLSQAIGNLPRSENGSFILPDGIIVLVDEDIEAYLDGTLEFIYPDDNLETE